MPEIETLRVKSESEGTASKCDPVISTFRPSIMYLVTSILVSQVK